MLRSGPHAPAGHISEEATLDAVATEKLKSNSRSHICLLLQPLATGMVQFVGETSRECDFMATLTDDDPGLNAEELFCRCLNVPFFLVPFSSDKAVHLE